MFESVFGNSIPRDCTDRRNGDIGQSVAKISLSEQILNWKPNKSLQQMCESALKWQKQNPKGFEQ